MEWVWTGLAALVTVLYLLLRWRKGGSPESPRVLHVFVGSQTRKTERWAEELAAFAQTRGVECRVREINSVSLARLQQGGVAVFMCSTHGKGDPPENAAKFYRQLEVAKPAKQLSAFSYSLFGFGNSDYFSTYNRTAKTIHRRLQALGAQTFSRAAFGDESEDIEPVFAQWRDAMLTAFLSLRTRNSKNLFETKASLLQWEVSETPKQTGKCEQYECATELYIKGRDWMITDWKLLRDDPSHPVYHLELDCTGDVYQPAQDLALFPQNSAADVARLAAAQGYSLSRFLSFQVKPTDVAPFPTPVTVGEAITRHCDLTGPVSKDCFRRLSDYAGEEGERRELQRLAGLSFSEFQQEVIKPKLSILYLLTHFPSLRVPIGDFVQIVSRIQPRYFTVSSSQKVHPTRLHLCIAVLRESCPSGSQWTGLCTGFLSSMCESRAYSPVRGIMTESRFRLPKIPAAIAMVGNGCGIAPFRAFAQELHYRAKHEDYRCPEVLVFFGCQSKASGFLYRHDFEQLLAAPRTDARDEFEHGTDNYSPSGILTRFLCTFSRDQARKVYIQEAVAKNRMRLADILFQENGCIYLCGSEGMVRDVHKLIVEAANERFGCDGLREVNKAKGDRRYVQESWG